MSNNYPSEIRTVNVIRYITPLREGGSLPAIVEADDGFSYVLKFRGASLYFHHSWANWETHLDKTFPAIKDHVLLDQATELEQAGELIADVLTQNTLEEIVDLIPDEWLEEESDAFSPAEKRANYVKFLSSKHSKLDLLTKEAEDARKASV